MGRPLAKHYWDQVIKVGKKWKCKKCGNMYSGGASRIKAHVDRTGDDIGPCRGDQDDERVQNVTKKKKKRVHNNVASGSINPQEAINAPYSLQVEDASEPFVTDTGCSINHQNDIEPDYLVDDVALVEDAFEPIDTNIGGSINNPDYVESDYLAAGLSRVHNGIGNNIVTGAFEEEINNLKQIISDLQCDEDDIKGQLQCLESQGKKCKGGVNYWLQKLEGFKRRAGDMIQSLLPSGIEKFTQKVEQHRKRKPLVFSNEIVGKGFEKNLKKVWELLKDDQVFIVGIYGMGGIGKTLLARHVRNEVKRKGKGKGTFQDAFWVTVSQNFSISKLQHDIAKEIGVMIDDEDDEGKRAEDLSSALETKEKSILVLDDVWKYIDLQKVGIPLYNKVNGIKVILTTRLKHVCQQMDCTLYSMIMCQRLYVFEDWELFLLKLGPPGTPVMLSSEVTNIAKSVVEKCLGIPLAINVMARTMKGKLNDVDWWKHTFNKLSTGEMGEEMEEEVLEVLKRSYDNLVDKDMQNCFLYSALLLPCDSKDDLVMKLVDKGLINGMRSLEEIFAEGRTILGKLEDHSLLNIGESILMSDLAVYIMKKSGQYRYAMFKYHKELPRMQEWTVDLEMVSLMYNEEEISGDMAAPCCPRLSTLILCEGKISSIPECFFIHMNALTVLDLSGNERLTALPNSVSSLKSLVSLLLRGCWSLQYVPPLGELQALSRLDISCCSLKEVPQGLEKLINLKWLDLSLNENLTSVSGSVISGLTNLQYLDLFNSGIKITEQDNMQGMKMLEYFRGQFLNSDTYNQFVRENLNNGFGPKQFVVDFGNKIKTSSTACEAWGLDDKIIEFTDCEEFRYLLLPRALAELDISNNNQWTCLCNGLSSEGTSSSSWIIYIDSCEKLKSLFCSADSCLSCKSSSHHYLTLEEIIVQLCHSMKEIFANARQPFSRAFSRLKHIDIYKCHAIENLLRAEMVPQLQNLETITVQYCHSIKEVFAMSNNDEDDGSIIKLPKLTKLELSDLPELRMVYKGIIVCGSSMPSGILNIIDCPKLERYPTIQTIQGF